MSPKHVRRTGLDESIWVRTIKALPILSITGVAIYFMWVVALPPMLERVLDIMAKGVVTQTGHSESVKLVHSLTNIEFIDSRIRGLAATFSAVQFIDAANWQCFTFLTDLGVLYAVFLFEAARKANYMTLAYFPLLLGYFMQFYGIGTLVPIYCFTHYLQSNPSNLLSRELRTTDLGYTASVLPVSLLSHYLPNYAFFSTFLDPQTRHVWSWIWQPFPVYISVAQILGKFVIVPATKRTQQPHRVQRDMPVIRATMYSLSAISAATWVYVLLAAPVSWAMLFVPNVAGARSGDEYIHLFLQFDEICAVGALLVWLGYHYGDLKSVGVMTDSWVGILLKGAVCLALLGPGATVGLGWLYREELWAAGNSGADAKVKAR